jgi:hypothetical protein
MERWFTRFKGFKILFKERKQYCFRSFFCIIKVMRNVTLSIQVFGAYLIGLSLILMFLPDVIISSLEFSSTDITWFRTLGIPLLVIGFHYEYAAAKRDIMFYRATTFARFGVFILFLIFVLVSWLEPQAVVFGITDALGAGWTWWGLQRMVHSS